MISPTIQRRLFAGEIKKLREGAGLSVREASSKLGRGPSRVYELERANFKVLRRPEVDALLNLYGVSSPIERDRLWGLVDSARGRRWWESYPWATALPDLEAGAERILTCEVLCIPGLLQTPDYARAMLLATGWSDAEADRRVLARMRRQEILTRSARPVQLDAVVDESALRKRVGGDEVMVAQVARLEAVSALPNVSIRVVSGVHSAMAGGFTVIGFGELSAPIAYLETPVRSGIVIDDACEVARYEALHARLTGNSCAITQWNSDRRGGSNGIHEEHILGRRR